MPPLGNFSKKKTLHSSYSDLVPLLAMHAILRNNSDWPLRIFLVVQLTPVDPVVHAGGVATFTCAATSSTIVSVEWLVNGTSLNSHPLQNVEQAFALGSGLLRFSNVSMDDNNTRVQCLATTSSEEVLSSNISLLRVQGI